MWIERHHRSISDSNTRNSCDVRRRPWRRRNKNLQWIRPISREVVHTIEIDDMESCSFLDASTIAIVISDESFKVINLQTAASRTASFDSPNDGIKDIDPAQIRIFSDAANYYVTELEDDGAFRLLGMSMTENLEPISATSFEWSASSVGDHMGCVVQAAFVCGLFRLIDGRFC